MKALVINSSPHMDKGNTALILTPFIEGMKEASADVEIFYTKKLKIEPCNGCFTCWLKTPGVCIHKDDMAAILPKLEAENTGICHTAIRRRYDRPDENIHGQVSTALTAFL